MGKGFVRKPPKRVDYLLRFTRDFPLAVIEAKARYKSATDAVQQARDYAEILDLKYAYATNGAEIIEIDYFKGTETRDADAARATGGAADPLHAGRQPAAVVHSGWACVRFPARQRCGRGSTGTVASGLHAEAHDRAAAVAARAAWRSVRLMPTPDAVTRRARDRVRDGPEQGAGEERLFR